MTLAQARQQVWTRRLIGWWFSVLTVTLLLLYLLKHAYLNAPGSLFFDKPGKDLREFIDALIGTSDALALLWWAIPPWQRITGLQTTPLWDYVYGFWVVAVVLGISIWLLNSARDRQAQISRLYDEIEHDAWRREMGRPGEAAPAYQGPTTVIQQGIWQQYAAPPESFQHTTLGIVLLGVLIGVIGLVVEYYVFQRNQP
jgi:hypothetical protein